MSVHKGPNVLSNVVKVNVRATTFTDSGGVMIICNKLYRRRV